MGRAAQRHREGAWGDAAKKLKMTSLTRTRLLLITIFLFPIVVIVLFWFFGNEPKSFEETLPVMPPR